MGFRNHRVCRQNPTPTSAHLGASQTPCLACHGVLGKMRGRNEARMSGAQGTALHARLPHSRGLARNVKAATQSPPPAESTREHGGPRSPSLYPQLRLPRHCLSVSTSIQLLSRQPGHPTLTCFKLSPLCCKPSCPFVCQTLYLPAFLSIYQVCLSSQKHLQSFCIAY